MVLRVWIFNYFNIFDVNVDSLWIIGWVVIEVEEIGRYYGVLDSIMEYIVSNNFGEEFLEDGNFELDFEKYKWRRFGFFNEVNKLVSRN